MMLDCEGVKIKVAAPASKKYTGKKQLKIEAFELLKKIAFYL